MTATGNRVKSRQHDAADTSQAMGHQQITKSVFWFSLWPYPVYSNLSIGRALVRRAVGFKKVCQSPTVRGSIYDVCSWPVRSLKKVVVLGELPPSLYAFGRRQISHIATLP